MAILPFMFLAPSSGQNFDQYIFAGVVFQKTLLVGGKKVARDL
jgi:hypothetical protein